MHSLVQHRDSLLDEKKALNKGVFSLEAEVASLKVPQLP